MDKLTQHLSSVAGRWFVKAQQVSHRGSNQRIKENRMAEVRGGQASGCGATGGKAVWLFPTRDCSSVTLTQLPSAILPAQTLPVPLHQVRGRARTECKAALSMKCKKDELAVSKCKKRELGIIKGLIWLSSQGGLEERDLLSLAIFRGDTIVSL